MILDSGVCLIPQAAQEKNNSSVEELRDKDADHRKHGVLCLSL
jgi:hypothetical protein